jgi:glycine/D-amino acid oxidase-like deaminating enzyme
MRVRYGKPLWLAGARAGRRYPQLNGSEETDVVIIGAGLTGAAIALAFAEAGVSVIVLEGTRVARGSTAASSALLLQEPDCGLGELERRYGARRARRVWALSRDAVLGLIDTIRRHRIECDLRERDSIFLTTDPARVAALRLESDRRSRAGFESEWLTPSRLQAEAGLSGRGAIRTSIGGQCDPFRACLGLLHAASRHRARVFEDTRVVRIDRSAHGARVQTNRGVVSARQVIVATGYATAEFRPLLGRFRLKETYAFATAPLAGRTRGAIGMKDVMFWDTERPYHYARGTADHRLLLGGGDRGLRAGRRRPLPLSMAVATLRREFERLLPGLDGLEIQFGWEGLFATTPDGLPYIGPHRRYPRHQFALGYGGNGMTFAVLAARLLLERWFGARSMDQELFAFSRHRAGPPVQAARPRSA